MKKISYLLFFAAILSLFYFIPAFSQEQPISGNPTASPGETEIQWVWGEVISVDAPNSSVTVKYLDYETDSEKEMVILTDAKTTYENIQSVAEIKPADTLSIDYVVTIEGKNLAKNISVEKPEDVTPGTEEKAAEAGTEAVTQPPEEEMPNPAPAAQ